MSPSDGEAPFWADRLAHAVGAAHVAADGARVRVRPGAPAELVDVVRIAGEVSARVGVGIADGIDLDLARMCNVLHVDETSLLVSAQAGITLEALEATLAERGLTLGALPSWSRARTLGAALAAPRPSEAWPRTGRFVQACAGIAALLADGTELSTRVAPRKATGPDLMHVVVGARGALGLITAATIRVQRRQEARLEAAFRLPAMPDALAVARALLVRGGRPDDLWVLADGTLALRVEGPEPLVHAERALAEELVRARGGEPVRYLPPPRVTAPPYERAVPIDAVDRAVPAPGFVGDAVRVVGWHVAGACVIDSARAPEPPRQPPDAALFAAMKARLDPDQRFVSWPGAA